jgi:hypothetical protein
VRDYGYAERLIGHYNRWRTCSEFASGAGARSIAIAVSLGVLVVLFYIVTLVKGPAVLVWPL